MLNDGIYQPKSIITGHKKTLRERNEEMQSPVRSPPRYQHTNTIPFSRKAQSPRGQLSNTHSYFYQSPRQ